MTLRDTIDRKITVRTKQLKIIESLRSTTDISV